MSRKILAIVGILLCSASAFGQEFVAPKSSPIIPKDQSGFQPPSSSFVPATQKSEKPETPHIESVPIIIPPKTEKNKATILPVPTIKVAPKIEPVQTGFSEFNPVRPEPPQPEPKKQQPPIEPVQIERDPIEEIQVDKAPVIKAPIEKIQVEEFPADPPKIIIPKPVQKNESTQLPEPKPAIETVELKEDTQSYRSSQYNQSGVSDYRLEVAREKARARRMRMEVKKWYGIDSARPVVSPRVNISVYSGYYNGVYSRHGYHHGNPYYNGSNFYYHVPVNR